ncbi:hypothetical protein ACKWTF_011143 [Chironomus riparius]
MEISDLLNLKPENLPKRKKDDDEELDSRTRASMESLKKQRIDEKILEMVNNADEDDEEQQVLDENGLKKLALLFERRVLKNQVTRLKFQDQPEKFMDSEIDLHEVIQQLQPIATCPDLYPLMVSLNMMSSMLELLAHPNTDIVAMMIQILDELTDVDVLNESEEGAEKLINCLQEQKITKLLVSCLDRFDETIKEESDAVHNTFSIFENLTEYKPEMSEEIAEQGLLAWMLKRLKVKQYDANKLYCSEILSILLQSTNENRILLGKIEGIDVLLQQLAVYKKHDPVEGEEETEYMENIFNSLCSSLLAKENRANFLKGEGCQLMNLMLREKKLSRNGALKVLDYACSGLDGKENCQKLVDILGLRTIFPLFMKTPKKNKSRLLSSEEYEEHLCSIISSLFRNTKGSQKQRVLSKFVENDFEKVDRLMELHLKYLEKVENIDRAIENQKKQKQQEDEEDDEEESSYLKRLSGGLFTLQLIDYIILEISVTSDGAKIKERIHKILNLRGSSLKTIKDIMREYVGNLGDAQSAEWREQEKSHVLGLINRF